MLRTAPAQQRSVNGCCIEQADLESEAMTDLPNCSVVAVGWVYELRSWHVEVFPKQLKQGTMLAWDA